MRAYPFILVIVLSFVAHEGIFYSGFDAKATEQADLVDIQAHDYYFNPAEISAKPDQFLRIRLSNWSNVEHSIAFIFPEGEVRMDQPVIPTASRIFKIRVPSLPGVYTYYCPVGNHAQLGMSGRIIVRKP